MSRTQVFCLLLALNGLYHLLLVPAALPGLVATVVVEAACFTGVFWLTRRQLRRATLLWLAIPYAFFLPTWLRPAPGLLMLVLLALSLRTAWRLGDEGEADAEGPDWQELCAFLALVAWLNLSGVGGYGYQTPDWRFHNARLGELVEHPWPVSYGTDANLVYYVGWYLPSAALGKLFGLEVAARSLLPWTLFGVTLALRWLCRLTGRRLAAPLVLVFVLFGPQDVFGVLFRAVVDGSADLPLSQWSIWQNTDDLDFWASRDMPFFLGSFLSNTFQLYWAPHEIVAGWLGGALAVQALTDRKIGLLVFGHALLCLWTPIIMLALAPLLLGLVLLGSRRELRSLLEGPSLFAVLALAPLFLVFYAGGSASSNPREWTLPQLDGLQWLIFLLFHLWTWGLYLASCWPMLRCRPQSDGRLAALLVLGFVALSLVVYGRWSNLICRGSAPLSFCLLVIVLRAWRHYRGTGRRGLLLLLAAWLALGSGSALLQNRLALVRYGVGREPVPSDRYALSYQFLGPDGSLFGRYLRRQR